MHVTEQPAWLKASDTVQRVIRRIEDVLVAIAGVFIGVMMVWVVGAALGRYLIRQELMPAYNLLIESILLPTTVFLGLSLGYRSGFFPRFQGLVIRFPLIPQKIIELLMLLLELVAFVALTYYGWEGAIIGMNQKLGFTAGMLLTVIPVWPFMFSVPVGASLLSFEVLIKLIKQCYWLGWGRRLKQETPQETAANII
ncbi:MAG: TRAP transporter small permease [Chloroflexi bacterium]|nr:TRAP transporter small permease [Chloroflexota bacterium]